MNKQRPKGTVREINTPNYQLFAQALINLYKSGQRVN
ncbi:hypothetical protein J2736_001215 [Paenibacillus qinlingensis]|uniref:Uncharacterized protein n=1 Tax=Paenibacillus qinlingensis TaxID=1837343 RepID=A0ABU1NRC0_9BACL|nr:hypothetical protein [Paenibacillus qinlingensis]